MNTIVRNLKRGVLHLGLSMCLCLPATAMAQRAQLQEGSQSLYKRILTLPGAALHEAPGHDQRTIQVSLPAFSIYYVYGEKTVNNDTWLQLGTRPEGASAGWIPRAKAEDWKSMLVMQYAPAGQRQRVLFFKEDKALVDVVRDRTRTEKVRRLLEGVAGGRADHSLLAAAEPSVAVDANSRPYLMPILNAVLDEEFHDGTYTTLVQVGGLNLNPEQPAAGPSTTTIPGAGAQARTGDLKDFRLGVVFVIDSTTSMGPYIDRTYETVRNVYAEFEKSGVLDRVAFGLVGYRDFVEHNPAIEYVTRVFQPLSLNTPPAQVLQNLKSITPSPVPTAGWSEDAFAGLHAAINDLDWEPFSARIIVLISDAGARSSSDPRAKVRNFGDTSVTEAANRKGITIFPIHLRTPEAMRANNIEQAERTYRGIARTGDSNTEKYVGIEAGSVDAFGAAIGDFTAQIRKLAGEIARNELTSRPDLSAPSSPPPQPSQAGPSANAPAIGNMLVNEVFRAQLEYLGQRAGVDAPRFYRAWAADRDLTNPRYDAFSVSAFLNRTQLSGLAQSLQNIVNRAKAADLDPGGFFDMLQSLSATMSADPNQGAAGQFANLADSGLLPDYLKALPYHSKVLMVNRELWLDWGMTGQQEFIMELEDKIAIYRAIDQDTRNWVDLGANVPGLEVYPIPLAYLP